MSRFPFNIDRYLVFLTRVVVFVNYSDIICLNPQEFCAFSLYLTCLICCGRQWRGGHFCPNSEEFGAFSLSPTCSGVLWWNIHVKELSVEIRHCVWMFLMIHSWEKRQCLLDWKVENGWFGITFLRHRRTNLCLKDFCLPLLIWRFSYFIVYFAFYQHKWDTIFCINDIFITFSDNELICTTYNLSL